MNKINMDGIVDGYKTNKLTEQQMKLCVKLRSMTGLGMISSRRCLEEYDWNIEKAFQNNLKYQWDGILRKQIL